eukprot:TRINITY_DN7270_c0_g1_i1.p1 TRINITY_DN7270_c0_g1~~TRINITY_DN7270_c0_g1_i1.p1  ORF type:complete len:328 (-),score=57.16 TRINITY_DN7270_c0_g1_i1:143-1126(-)
MEGDEFLPTQFFENVDKIAHLILDGKVKNIAFLSGAGISVGAGIPDFRSPGGMYDTLKPDLLTATETQRNRMRTDPTFVVNKELFFQNQLCYLELRRPFILGLAEQKWKATLAHWFIDTCHKKGLLRRLYTQNIDGLDYQTNIPIDKMVPVHGSMGRIECEFCHAVCPIEDFREKVKRQVKDIYDIDPTAPATSTPIPCVSCSKNGLKPATVLYGSALPTAFFDCKEVDFPDHVDLFFVVGTSLTVSPANFLVTLPSKQAHRVLVNREPVGRELGLKFNQGNDLYFSQDCDIVFGHIAKKLGWLGDLLAVQYKLAPNSKAILQALNK